MGSHDVFIADIVGVSCDEFIVDENGRMCFDKANLLAYAHGEYYTLGQVVGKFGFSTDKKKEEKPNATNKKSGTTTVKKVVPAESKKKPFYESAPRGKSPKKKPTDKNRGAPHGRKSGGKK